MHCLSRGTLVRRVQPTVATLLLTSALAACPTTNTLGEDASLDASVSVDTRGTSDGSVDAFIPPDAFIPTATHALPEALSTLVSPRDPRQVPYDGRCLGIYRNRWMENGTAPGVFFLGTTELSPFEPLTEVFLGFQPEPQNDAFACVSSYQTSFEPTLIGDVPLIPTGQPLRYCERSRRGVDEPMSRTRVHHLIEKWPNYTVGPSTDGLHAGEIRIFNQWTPGFTAAVLEQAGREPGDDFRAFEIMATDCQHQFVRGMGAIVTQNGRDFVIDEADVFRPRLNTFVGPYEMESLIYFDMTEDRGTAPITVRTFGHLVEGGPEVMLGCETFMANHPGPISVHIGPLRGDYPPGHPCLAYVGRE